MGLLVAGARGGAPGQPVVHPVDRRAHRGPARLPRPDAPRGRADDAGHGAVRAERRLQPAVDPHPRADVLRRLPAGPAVAAHTDRRGLRGRVLRAVLRHDVARLVPAQPGRRGGVPATGAGSGGAAAPQCRRKGRRVGQAGGDTRPGTRRQPAHRPGVVRPCADRRAGGPGAVAVQPRLAGAGDGGRDRRRGVPGGGRPADRGHGRADPVRRRYHPGRHGGHRLCVLRHRVPRHIRRLPPRGPAGPDLAQADQLPRAHPRRGAHVRPCAVRAGRDRAGGLLAAAQRLAARGAVAGQRRTGTGRGAEGRYPHLYAVRADLARGPAVGHHAVHLVRADPRDGRVP